MSMSTVRIDKKKKNKIHTKIKKKEKPLYVQLVLSHPQTPQESAVRLTSLGQTVFDAPQT